MTTSVNAKYYIFNIVEFIFYYVDILGILSGNVLLRSFPKCWYTTDLNILLLFLVTFPRIKTTVHARNATLTLFKGNFDCLLPMLHNKEVRVSLAIAFILYHPLTAGECHCGLTSKVYLYSDICKLSILRQCWNEARNVGVTHF